VTEGRPPPARLGDVPHRCAVTTRRAHNDAGGHLDNAAGCGGFDTAMNRWLIARGTLSITRSKAVGLVVETGCRYRRLFARRTGVVVGDASRA